MPDAPSRDAASRQRAVDAVVFDLDGTLLPMEMKDFERDYFRRLCYNVGVSQRLRAGIYRRYPKAVVLECMKWAATLLLSLTMSPRKSLWLIRMRYEISRGLFSRAGH